MGIKGRRFGVHYTAECTCTRETPSLPRGEKAKNGNKQQEKSPAPAIPKPQAPQTRWGIFHVVQSISAFFSLPLCLLCRCEVCASCIWHGIVPSRLFRFGQEPTAKLRQRKAKPS